VTVSVVTVSVVNGIIRFGSLVMYVSCIRMEGERKRVAFDLSVRTYEEAAEVAAMLKTGAGGGGQTSKGPGQVFTFNNGFGKPLTTAEVPLGNKPIKRAAMTHLWCAHVLLTLPSFIHASNPALCCLIYTRARTLWSSAAGLPCPSLGH